jgi:hypothetical protein
LDLEDLDAKALKTIRKQYKAMGTNETIEVTESTTTLKDEPAA